MNLRMNSVYKYLPPERIKFLEDGLLRFTQPGALNDPFECLPALPAETINGALRYMEKLIHEPIKLSNGLTRGERRSLQRENMKTKLKAYKQLRGNTSAFSERFYKDAAENLNGKVGILSLSRRWNSGLMWSHYTNSYAGFCVGFQRNHQFFQFEENPSRGKLPLLPVIYSQQRTLIPDRRMNPIEAFGVVLTKSLDWGYEQEERVIDLLSEAKITIDASPFNIALFDVPLDAVTEIIIGMRADKPLRCMARNASKRLKVPLYETKISGTSFDVERVRVEV